MGAIALEDERYIINLCNYAPQLLQNGVHYFYQNSKKVPTNYYRLFSVLHRVDEFTHKQEIEKQSHRFDVPQGLGQ